MFPVAAKVLADDGQIVALVKPQFEAGREQVGKKGIVRDLDVRKEVLRNVAGYAAKAGFSAAGLSFSPVTGAKGNVEFLLYLTKKFVNINIERKIDDIVFDSHRELE